MATKFETNPNGTVPVWINRVAGSSGKAYIYTQDSSYGGELQNRYGIVNETTLEVSTVDESTSGLSHNDNTITTNIPYYNLSEKNGVEKIYLKKGDILNSSAITEKYRSYFTGATNRDGGLPEGTYIAYENSDTKVLVGIGPDNSQIAIGKNGGAAILKASVSNGPGTIDISKVDKYLLGFVDTGNSVIYKLGKWNATTQNIITVERK